jgi:ascorbate-specific PTS system EIIC-type component UlaA
LVVVIMVVMVMIRRHTVMRAMLLLGLLLQMAVMMVVMSRITLQGVQRCRYNRTGSEIHLGCWQGCKFRMTDAICPPKTTQIGE